MVIAGDDKGKTGEVLRVDARNNKVLIQGINRVFKHLRRSKQHPQGGRIQKELPINMSKVMPVDPTSQKPTRVKFRTTADGQKERVAVKSGAVLGVIKKKSE
jgi:large subunit ribosomal protein L24